MGPAAPVRDPPRRALLVSARLPLEIHAAPATASQAPRGIPRRFWAYAGFAVLYGICETVNGNWAQLDMTELGSSTTAASLALTAFWAMVTLGRILFAAIEARFPSRLTSTCSRLVLAGAFVLIALLPDDQPALGIVAFGLAGLGCSALLPLTISFGQKELSAYAAAAAGGVIAFYQLGYGIAAFGVGPLRDAGVELSTVYALAAIVAVAMCAWSFVVAGRRPSRRRAASRDGSAMTGPSGEQVEIAHGDQQVVVVEVGGGLRTYSVAGREVLDGYGDDEMSRRAAGRCSSPGRTG